MDDWIALVANGPFVAVVIIVFVGGVLRGFVGFGGAMVTVPALTLAFGPLVAVPIAAIFGLPASIQLLPTAVRQAERRIVLPICVAIVVCSPVGTWILVSIDPRLTKMAIGLLVVAMTLMLARGWKVANDVPVWMLYGAGGLGGLVQGVAGIGGPPVVAVALSRDGSPDQQRANVIGVMTAIGISSLLPIWWFGLFTREVILLGVTLVPVYSGATWLGSHQFTSGGRRYFRLAALVLLGIVGIVTVLVAVRDYWTT